MSQQYVLKKENFNNFVEKVMADYDFIAPVKAKKNILRSKSLYQKISNPEDIFLDDHSYHTVKGFFNDPREKLFDFDGNKIINPVIELRQRVFFGLRKCDLNGIWHQDMVFLDNKHQCDPFYKARRDVSVLIGLHCNNGFEHCFCNSLDLRSDFHDLMFFDKNNDFIIEVGSDKGRKIIEIASDFLEQGDNLLTEEDRKIKNMGHELKTTNIKKFYHHEDWKTKGADKCLACGACNMLCPNCHCFTIEDDVDFSLKKGTRIRKPAPCQLKHFTRVAGDHIFRQDKTARFKHRIYHQLQYFQDRHDVQFCTGCGRCIAGCPARIDWIEIINNME
ncbi:4Fe-4S dicluster domain-containing protein [Candidatus Woesearchaeota archaeon]|nr:4Fe-4S dicluster domain-containing protein [Candidatus Woesearchaeota archaeon]